MSENILNTKITGDSKNYQDAVNQAKRATNGFNEEQQKLDVFTKSMSSSLGGLSNKVQELASKYNVFNIASSAIAYNGTIEQYQTSFETMTGSASKASDIMIKLKDIITKTPFDMPQLAETTQLLMNYGFGADDAMSKMTMLGNISQGNSDKMNQLANAYGQMFSSGKVTTEGIQEMINAGFNPLQEISNSTGESMESLSNRLANGTLSVDEITASMERSTSQGGTYFNSMGNQSDTLNGRMSTLQNTVKDKLGSAFQGLTDILRDYLIPFAIELLTNWEKYEPIITVLAIIIGTLTVAYIAYNVQQTLATAGLTLWQSVALVASSVTTALGAAFTFLTSPLGLVILAIGAIIAIGYLLINHWTEIKAFALDTWSSIISIFQTFDEFLTGVFNTDWTTCFGSFGNILNAFFANASNIWESIKQVFQGVINFVKGVFTGDWGAAWNGVVSIFSGIFNGIVAIVKSPINLVLGFVNKMISGMETGINFLIGCLNTFSFKVPKWVPIIGGEKFGFNFEKLSLGRIPYLLHGTNNWQGGFARMNEGGRGELTYLPDGSRVIPHDISVKYAKESARANGCSMQIEIGEVIDYNKMSNSLIKALKNVSIILKDENIGKIVDDRLLEVM